jgi:hypothetical protein
MGGGRGAVRVTRLCLLGAAEYCQRECHWRILTQGLACAHGHLRVRQGTSTLLSYGSSGTCRCWVRYSSTIRYRMVPYGMVVLAVHEPAVAS